MLARLQGNSGVRWTTLALEQCFLPSTASQLWEITYTHRLGRREWKCREKIIHVMKGEGEDRKTLAKKAELLLRGDDSPRTEKQLLRKDA